MKYGKKRGLLREKSIVAKNSKQNKKSPDLLRYKARFSLHLRPTSAF
jgi:hypothetical protein